MDESKKQALLQIIDESIPEFTSQLSVLKEYLDIIDSTKTLSLSIEKDTDISDLEEASFLLKIGSFINISFLDLCVTTKNLVKALQPWEIIYFVKQGYSLIYEIESTYQKHNTHLNAVIAKYPELEKDYLSVQLKLRAFKKEFNFKKIADVRNVVGAHLDTDFKKYYELVFTLGTESDVKAVGDFVNILADLQNLTNKLVNYLKDNIEKNGFEATKVFERKTQELRDLIEKLKPQ